MQPVTQGFLDTMKADRRRVYGRVQIDYTDPFMDQSVVAVANENAYISYPGQTTDGLTGSFAKFASLDGSWALGDGYEPAPGPDEAKFVQMGWWGEQLAGTGGAFVAPYPTLTVEFFTRPIDSFSVTGDSKRQEWPVDFTIKLYNEGDGILYTETVTGNTEIEWSKPLDEAVLGVAKMVLEITKWSHAGRQVKILEFFSSLAEVYEVDDIVSIRLLEEQETSQGGLPVGNISSNEIDIRLLNEEGKFDIGNLNSPLHGLLRANRRIRAWLGTEVEASEFEYVPLGMFWSGDWSVPEDGLYAHTTGRDRMELLRLSTYDASEIDEDKTLYDIAIDVLSDAGLTETEYWVDPGLQQFTVPYPYFESQSHREALRKIAEACVGRAYCDREGLVRVEGPMFAGGAADLTITSDDYFSKDNPAKWEEVANYIEIETQPLKPGAAKEVYRSNELESITAGQTKTITVSYNHIPCIDTAASLENAPAEATITKAAYYAWGASITVSSTVTGTFELVVDATPLEVQNREKVIAQDENSIKENGVIKFTFPGNPLVQTRSMAQKIADTILGFYKEPRSNLYLEWRGNPALELGDVVAAPDYQERELDEWGSFLVIRQELEYNGGLRAKLNGRRIAE